jgi:hypothetical protein
MDKMFGQDLQGEQDGQDVWTGFTR